MKNTRTRIKVCGITTPEDARIAANCGVDAIGLVFFNKSPRAISIDIAQHILNALPAFVTTVGLFVNEDSAAINKVLDSVALDLLQFHGNESESFCRQFSMPYLKALQVKPGFDIAAAMVEYESAQGIIFDTWHQDLAGGTGQQFDWNLLTELGHSNKLILAGGLKPENIAEAITTLHPYAVDVSSGVEVSPGKKSVEKIMQFVNEVKGV